MKTTEQIHELMETLIAAVRVIEPDDGELAARVANHALGLKRRWLKEQNNEPTRRSRISSIN